MWNMPLVSRSLLALAMASLLLVLARAPAVPATWTWPLAAPHRVVAVFVAPLTPYSAGHRGLDLATLVGTPVLAPSAGIVSFVGRIADRELISISQGDGVISTLEPVNPTVSLGDHVSAGQQIGVAATGGHCTNVCVHFGVRVFGEYVSPLIFLDGVERAVLLPLE